jgi:hypothetical protein
MYLFFPSSFLYPVLFDGWVGGCWLVISHTMCDVSILDVGSYTSFFFSPNSLPAAREGGFFGLAD